MMRFIEATEAQIERLQAKSPKRYDALPAPKSADAAIAGVDDAGEVRIVMKAEKVAEVYMVIDHAWETPAMRWAMIERAYLEIRKRLKEKGYTMAYCFFADGVPNGYIRRLVDLGAERVIERCIRFRTEVQG
jgi:hypothetical protein